MDGISVKTMQENLGALGPYSMFLLIPAWFIAAGMYFTLGTFFSAILALIIFTVLCPVGMFIGNKIRTLVQPDLVLTSGVGELVKTRIYWAIGPQIIAMVIALILSATVLHMRDTLDAEKEYKQAISALKDSDSVASIAKDQIPVLEEYQKKCEELEIQPKKEFEKREESKERIKNEIAALSSMLEAVGLKENNLYRIKSDMVEPGYLGEGEMAYNADKEILHFASREIGISRDIPGLQSGELIEVQFADNIIKICTDEVRNIKQSHMNFNAPVPRETEKKIKENFGQLNFSSRKMSKKIKVEFLAQLILPSLEWKIVRVNMQPRSK